MAIEEDFEMPVAKRQKFEQISAGNPQSSRLFAPFRTIGLVSPTSIPFTSVPLGKTTFQISTSVGRSLQTYDLRRGLNLVFLSRPQCPATITATCAYRDRVFAAWGEGSRGAPRGVWVLKRGRLVQELETSSTYDQCIERLVVFGAWIIGCGPKAIEVWRNETYDHYTTIIPPSQKNPNGNREFTGHICTLPTFLNKVFAGREDGSIELYNVSTGKLVHVFKPVSTSSGRVTTLSATPAISLLAVAHAQGSITIFDIEQQEVVIHLQQHDQHLPVTCITFRTDGAGAGDDGRSEGVMATSSSNGGDITLWDLNKGGKVVGVLRGAHEVSVSSQTSGITKIEFLPGQPVIVSSGFDNSLKSWIFDQNPFSPIPRPLHSRSGHAAPITNLKFLPAASDGSEAAGKWLMSAAQDRSLWGFSLRKDGQSSELSQGNIKAKAKKVGKITENSSTVEDLKAPAITAMACSLNRDGGMGAVGGPIWTNPKAGSAEESGMTGWESIVTAHDGDSFARTWFWGRKRAGRWAFQSGDRKPVTSVAVTACGTFALTGSAGGSLDMFNLQSGMHRRRFPPKLKPTQAKELRIQRIEADEPGFVQRGHSSAITGIVVDSLNQTVISTSLDGEIIFWDFSTGNITQRTNCDGAAPIAIRYNSASNLVSMACDDLCIRVMDIETKRIVRELWGCVGQIYDHCFSHDGRWIVTCSMDSIVRVFDLATGHLIDAFKTATCTNVAFSSTGEFLATAHAGSIGINIWNNKSLFTHIPIRQIDEEKGGVIDLTTSSEFDAVSQLATQLDILDDDGSGVNNGAADEIDIDQLDKQLLTLSLVPQSRWQTLLNLDTIRQRNKPVAPPEKPKAAPFFLGSANTPGLNQDTAPNSTPEDALALSPMDNIAEEQSRIARLASFANNSTSSVLTALLDAFDKTSEPTPVIKHLIELPPSATDLELRSLTLSELPTFVKALTYRLRQRRDFELVNTWMNILLRVHGEFIQVKEVQDAVVEFRTVMEEERKRLEELVGWVRGVGEWLRSGR